MKILVLHNQYQNSGGEDSVFASETTLLSENGHEVIEYIEDNHKLANESMIVSAVNTIWSFPTQRSLAHLLDEVQPDVAHFHNTFPRISPAAYYTCQRNRVPVVQTLHNYRLLCPGGLIREGHACELCFGKPLMEPGMKHACYRGSRPATAVRTSMLLFHRMLKTYRSQVDTYIALTDFARNKFIEWGFPAKRIVVKPNFVDSEAELGMEIGKGQGNYALFVGRLTEEKGLLTLLDAWQNIDLPLKIVGTGPLQSVVESRCADMAQASYLGHKNNRDVMTLMEDATLLVFPSQWYEGCPRSIVEAFAKGLPVVASNMGGMSSIVEHGESGLHFTPSDTDDLADKVNWLCAHPEELQQMRLNARHAYENIYSVEKNYEMLMDIYESTIERYPRK